MNSLSRSILARSLMTGAAVLAVMAMAPGVGPRRNRGLCRAMMAQRGADGVNPGDAGMTGDNGESVTANAGSAHPVYCVPQ